MQSLAKEKKRADVQTETQSGYINFISLILCIVVADELRFDKNKIRYHSLL